MKSLHAGKTVDEALDAELANLKTGSNSADLTFTPKVVKKEELKSGT